MGGDAADQSPARGVLQGVAGRAVYFAAGYLASIVLARWLGPAAYGAYGLVMSVLLWVEQIGKFTFAPAAAKLIAERGPGAQALEHTASFLNFAFFAVVFALLWLAAPGLSAIFELGDDGVRWFRIAAVDLPIFGWYALNRGVLLGRRQFFTASVADALYSVMKLVGAVVLLTVWLSVASALAVNILASLVAWTFLLSRVSIRLRRPAPGAAGPLVRLAVPLGFYMMTLQTLSSLDLWLLKTLGPSGNEATVGLYVAARNVALVPSVIFMVVSDILLPSISGALAAGDTTTSRRYLQGGVRFLCVCLLPVCLLFAFGADAVMTLLYSSSFRAGGLYLSILIWSAVSLPFLDLFAAALSAKGHPFLSGTVIAVLLPAAILLNVFLVPAFGAVGAAAASVVIGALAALAVGLLVYQRFGPLLRSRTMLNTTIALIVMAAAASRIDGGGIMLGIALAGCLGIYGLMLWVLGELTLAELRTLAVLRGDRRRT
jgi:O-antigen/teichoic acid export membrane protein